MSGKTVLVIAAHPDDEVLGCGGSIARHVEEGDTVHVLIMAEGLTSRSNTESETLSQSLSELGKSAQAANAILGVTSLELLRFPDNSMDSVIQLDVVKSIEAAITKYRPNTVYTHHTGDVNIDHRIIHQAVVTACRPIPGQCVETLLFFEIASSTEWQPPGSATPFDPNWFTDISATLDKKLSALNAYESEMRPWPHARSIQAVEHLNRWRGATISVNAAEAFVLGRYINPVP